MNEPGNLEKRIKRQVQGKVRSFFVSTLPGIEALCFKELTCLGIPMADTVTIKGGIEFNGRVHDCYLANLKLRTANRILMRITSFTASNFRQLEKKLSGIPWELYLHKDASREINVTSKHSRLIHTDAIATRFETSIEKNLKKSAHQPAGIHTKNHSGSAGRPQKIFIRAENDLFTVSIDSSGELLHKRGLKIQGGIAPVRETIAAAILTFAGYQPEEPLIDPMCGSGTFSLEAAMIAKNIPAGWFREFAFMDWPVFKPARWRHIRGEAGKNITPPSKPLIFASDIDPENSRTLSQLVKNNHLSDTINVCAADFFDLRPSNINELPDNLQKSGLIVLNPPYGRRLGSKGTVEKMFGRIGEKLKNDFKGWKVALLLPDKHLLPKIPFKTSAHDFIHGGLSITLVTGKIH